VIAVLSKPYNFSAFVTFVPQALEAF